MLVLSDDMPLSSYTKHTKKDPCLVLKPKDEIITVVLSKKFLVNPNTTIEDIVQSIIHTIHFDQDLSAYTSNDDIPLSKLEKLTQKVNNNDFTLLSKKEPLQSQIGEGENKMLFIPDTKRPIPLINMAQRSPRRLRSPRRR